MIFNPSFLSRCALCSPIFGTLALAAPGDLDSSFGTAGIFQSSFNATYGGSVRDVAVQTDGKILIAAESWMNTGGGYGFLLVRLNANGTLDTSLDTDGFQLHRVGNSGSVGGMDISPVDGKIFVAGSKSDFPDPNSDFAVMSYNTDGSVNTGFNTTGLATTSFIAGRDVANDVHVQPDGKVVAAGASYYNQGSGSPRFALVRYNTDGSLDTDFDGDGKVLTDTGNECTILAIDSTTDGKLVAVGDFYNSSRNNGDIMIARYNGNGTLDTTFDTDGIVYTHIGGWDKAYCVSVLSDGKILVGGTSDNTERVSDFTLVRYLADGSLDTTFGGDGIVTTDFDGGYDSISKIIIQGDGKIIAVGSSGNGPASSFVVARYLSDGSLDSTFGTDGKVTGSGETRRELVGVAQQADGKFVAAGHISDSNGANEIAVARFKALADPVVPTRKPDIKIGSTSAVAIGSNIYNTTGVNQTQNLKITSGKTKTVFIGLQNDGTAADSFKLKGTVGNQNFDVTYFKGSRDVTAAVVAGTYTTAPLAAGATESLKVTIEATTKRDGKTRDISLVATSVAKATATDKALIDVTSQAKPK